MGRLDECEWALCEERTRFNATCAAARQRGEPVRVPMLDNNMASGQEIRYMDGDMWLHCGSDWTGPGWCCCNDGFWAALLAAAGVKRNPLFASYTSSLGLVKDDRFELTTVDSPEPLTGQVISVGPSGYDAWVNNGGYFVAFDDIRDGSVRLKRV